MVYQIVDLDIHNSQEYKEIASLRERSGHSKAVVVEGVL